MLSSLTAAAGGMKDVTHLTFKLGEQPEEHEVDDEAKLDALLGVTTAPPEQPADEPKIDAPPSQSRPQPEGG